MVQSVGLLPNTAKTAQVYSTQGHIYGQNTKLHDVLGVGLQSNRLCTNKVKIKKKNSWDSFNRKAFYCTFSSIALHWRWCFDF